MEWPYEETIYNLEVNISTNGIKIKSMGWFEELWGTVVDEKMQRMIA